MELAARAVGWKPHQLNELINELDPQHQGDVTYEEFMLIMRFIEQKQASITMPNSGDQSMKQSSDVLPEASMQQESVRSPKEYVSNQDSLLTSNKQSYPELSAYDLDKKKYGALLPKTGVYFLPDERIIAFLKVINEMRKRYEGAGNYLMANRYKKIFDRWS